MSAYLFDWASLLGRWLHLITGIAWIGASFYFVWLDNSLLPPKRKELIDAGVGGEVWAVHGGGFYNAQKYKTAPVELPEPLHWFYWEAYTTWLSGFFLLCLLYFGQAEIYLIDPSVMALSKPAAIGIALAFLAGGWLIYDRLCRFFFQRSERTLALLVATMLSIVAWALCQLYSGRGAYILFGAVIGTIMVANVAMVIIPGQRNMVEAMRAGLKPDPVYGIRGKQRSVHNNYFTLPVLFIMISNHFAMTYRHPHAWAVLAVIMAAGVFIRHFFNLRHKGRVEWIYPSVGVALLLGLAVALAPPRPAASNGAVDFARVETIIRQRCVSCHAAHPTQPGFASAPAGVMLDDAQGIARNAPRIYQQAVQLKAMPLANMTNMTDEERAQVGAWYEAGAKTR